jgi:anti-anti-sigma factor
VLTMRGSVEQDELRADGGIELTEDVDTSHVRLWGDVDAGLRDQASQAMLRCLERGVPVVIDVADVTFIDSSGLAFVLQLHKVGEDEGMPVVVRNPPVLMLDLLEMLGMGEVIPMDFTSGGDGPAADDDDAIGLARV